MKKTLCAAGLLLGIAVVSLGTDAGFAAGNKKGAEYVPGEVLVKYKSGLHRTLQNAHTADIRAKKIWDSPTIGVQHLRLPEELTVEEAVAMLRENPDVEYAEPNYIFRVCDTPDDPYFDECWGLGNTGQLVNGITGTAGADINAIEAWDIVTGSGDVVVAVIDTGVNYIHPDLAANIWINSAEIPDNDVDDDGNDYTDDVNGWDFVGDDNDPMDFDGHGTHVAGIIGAVGNNGLGVAGVSWTVKIMPIRALGPYGGSADMIVQAIEYATYQGADIINCSFAGGGFSQTLKDAIDTSPALFVCAAGNDGRDSDSYPAYPSAYTSRNIVSAAATDQNDNLASFSNYGANSVDVGAPGVNVYSTILPTEVVFSDNFDDGDLSGWTTGGTNNTWAVTTEDFGSPSHSLTDSPGGNYSDYTDSYCTSPAIDLSGKQGCELSYKVNIEIESIYDFLAVEASADGLAWKRLGEYSGTTLGDFLPFNNDLSEYDGEAAVYVRFRLYSDFSYNYDGAHIDDVEVNCVSPDNTATAYDYHAGTSMAAPYVSGLAALIKSQNPGRANIELKDIILDSSEPKSSLNGKVKKGRINAYNALTTPVPLSAPDCLLAIAVSGVQIDLNWTDNSSTEIGFEIERKTGAGGTYSLIATVNADVTSYSDTGLQQDTTYYYRVRCYDGVSYSDYSNESSATTVLLAVSLPHYPSISYSSAAISDSQIDLVWYDRSSNEAGFEIERKTGEDGTYKRIATAGANVEEYSDQGLNAGTTYYYRMRSYNSVGYSDYSSEWDETTTPAAPAELYVTAVSSGSLNLAWTKNNSGPDSEYRFEVERKKGAGGTYSKVATVYRKTTYTDDDRELNEKTTYHYRLRSYKSYWDYSSYSNSAGAKTMLAAPGTLYAEALSTDCILLTWKDNSSFETGYEIERKKGYADTYSQIARVGEGTTYYSDTGLEEGTQYYYRIRAYMGDKDYSSYSKEKYAYTQPSDGGDGGDGGGGGCFIATAAFGIPAADEVKLLCRFRDECLLKNKPGKIFVRTYYRFSPFIADYIRDKKTLKLIVRKTLKPVIKVAEFILERY